MSSTTMQPQAITVNKQNLAVIKLTGLSSDWHTYYCTITPTSPGPLTLALHLRDEDHNNSGHPSTEVDLRFYVDFQALLTASAIQAAPSIHLKMLRTPGAPDRLQVLQDFKFNTHLVNDMDKENGRVWAGILDGEGSLKHIKQE
ncbi:hypothetical protein PAXRUDRAFT_13371 [Paxillus rubicundulus Ve08.2h10]|uniref:Uncharacterized protein n=1 Tax=Paxillus rubicundulus Ve08.2h10 TaxID=930991 RepID=A0A0D0DLJ2_9AGAM|nr:hypothetical protein PAXRUDRAFT_13371 [Paxillus rubicundulus Ve08.2h10]